MDSDAIDAILEFLPIFERAEANVSPSEDINSDEIWSVFELDRFLAMLYKKDVLINFNWSEWQHEAERFYRDPRLLERADLITIRKLLTLHVRKDRFDEGHLDYMCEEGHITAILRRLKEIHTAESSYSNCGPTKLS